ncbi:MAG: hypothetical protein M3Q07_11375 [Pseudobdellovibrionaceae bacterium]|nr:hypothetical protein [Pseudobdellovibrionaceae bacterium]
MYKHVHDKDIASRIQSGIPFKLMSVAVEGNSAYRRIVRIEFDLWSEILTIETLGGVRVTSNIKDASSKICQALSFPEAGKSHRYRYRLLLNPLLEDNLKKLRKQENGRSGLLEVNWGRLARDLETEKVLIEGEFTP